MKHLHFLYKSSAVAEMGDRFATVDIAQREEEWGLLCPVEEEGGWDEAYLRTKSHLDPSSRSPQQT